MATLMAANASSGNYHHNQREDPQCLQRSQQPSVFEQPAQDDQHPHAAFLQHVQHQQRQGSETTLSPRQMLAAQQHFGFAPLSQHVASNQRDGQSAPDSTPSGGWNDDSELFLRNLLANNISSPPSSISGASYVAPSPSYNNGASSGEEYRNSSLSPSSSVGYQGLHDFIHSATSFSTPAHSDANGYAMSFDSMNGKPAMFADQQQQNHATYSFANGQTHLDPNALQYFVNSMVQGHGHHMPGSASIPSGLDPSLVSPAVSLRGEMPQSSFQPQLFAQQSMPAHQYQQLQQSFEHQQQQHPALEGRKRSAPMAPTLDSTSKTNSAASRLSKKVRTQSSSAMVSPDAPYGETAPMLAHTSSLLPRMEVGSNATALAAIERLKAKRRAEVEQRVKQEEGASSSPRKDVGKSRGTDDGNNPEPLHKNQKKVAHNAIERRYRNNINDRITALRNAVPALRELRPKKPGSSRKGKGAQEQDLVDGVPAATKLNKATILGKATEYIRYLKGRETRLVSEVAGLRELIRSLEGGEELLELWEGEMEKVVAEQEAKVKASFAEDDSFDFGGEDDDEDDEEEDDFEGKPSSRSSSTSSSSRYMMGLFMGFSVLGGGAELMSEHAASAGSEAAHPVVRASSGRVLGATHQLLKRGMAVTNVKVAGVHDVPHHFDHVPSHLLAVEVARGLVLLACLVFIFWPLIGRFVVGQQTTRVKITQSSADRHTQSQRRKEMLAALARSNPRPHEMDMSMRKFIDAPLRAPHAGVALAAFLGRELTHRLRLVRRERIDEERAAVWCRLLELEASLGPLAHRSLLARLHTILTVATLPNLGHGSKTSAPVMNAARVNGTMAIAIIRACRGNLLGQVLADRCWTMARRCRLLAQEEQEDQEQPSKDGQIRWIDSVLEYPLSDAITLCPSPTVVATAFTPSFDADTRASLLAPLASVAAIHHGRRLTQVWSLLLSQIVQRTCPPAQNEHTPTVSEFMKHHSDVKIHLPIVANAADQERLSAHISRLAISAPNHGDWQTLSNVTFGTWALLVGNINVARSVAAAMLTSGDVADLPASAIAFVKLVFDGSESLTAPLPTTPVDTSSEVDALAAATLTWLQFLRLLSLCTKGGEEGAKANEKIVEKALDIRRLLASARLARDAVEEDYTFVSSTHLNEGAVSHRSSLSSTISTPTEGEDTPVSLLSEETTPVGQEVGMHLDETLDTLTDVLALLGRKAALGMLHNWKRSHDDHEQHDSGVEFGI